MSGANLARKAERRLLFDGKLDRGIYDANRGPNTQLGKRERTIERRRKQRGAALYSDSDMWRDFKAGHIASPGARYGAILQALIARANGSARPVPLMPRGKPRA